ncbi:hypothetical protein LSAT2_004334 [Lamellibrachia satsuma]|nr:hypothetical protein LSAT2_004334 [Lamellibrachia satsuma]
MEVQCSTCITSDLSTTRVTPETSLMRLPQRSATLGLCSGNTTCAIPVMNIYFGDPCPNTYKYLEVYFACVKNKSVP